MIGQLLRICGGFLEESDFDKILLRFFVSMKLKFLAIPTVKLRSSVILCIRLYKCPYVRFDNGFEDYLNASELANFFFKLSEFST